MSSTATPPTSEISYELSLPWSLCVELLKLHIINRLVRNHGMSLADATARQRAALSQYDALIDEILRGQTSERAKALPVVNPESGWVLASPGVLKMTGTQLTIEMKPNVCRSDSGYPFQAYYHGAVIRREGFQTLMEAKAVAEQYLVDMKAIGLTT